MRSPDFWRWFDEAAGPQLTHRTAGFRKIFTYLDRYACFHPGSAVFSVDRDPEAAALCRSLIGDRVHVHTGDSLAYLKSLADRPPPALEFLDLLYLDSFDVDLDHPLPSAIHHLKELLAIAPLVSSE